MRLARTPIVALLLACASLAACETEQPKTILTYTSDAKRAYDAAMAEFNGHNWIEAQNLFRDLKRKYSSARKYVLLAELRIADADFEQEKYTEAIHEYRQFVHDHQGQNIADDISYARSRIAEAQYKQIDNSFFLSSIEERDQAQVRDAYKELRSFVHDYPEAKQTPKMRKLLAEITGRLIKHELYVARFYLRKDNYDAAVARIQYAMRNYAHRSSVLDETDIDALEPEALLLMGETYLKMHKWGDAREAFNTILHSFPTSALTDQATRYLAYMKDSGV